MSSQLSRERRQKSSSCNGIFQLRIVLLHYCVWVDLFVVYMLPIFTGNVPGPLPLTHTASNEKLGEGLGTRLQIACVWLCLVCEVDFSEDAVFSFRAMFLASSCSFNVTLFRVFIFLPMSRSAALEVQASRFTVLGVPSLRFAVLEALALRFALLAFEL